MGLDGPGMAALPGHTGLFCRFTHLYPVAVRMSIRVSQPMSKHESDDGQSQERATILSADDVPFVPERVAVLRGDDLTPATATCLIRAFASCPECEADLDPGYGTGKAEDRDVIYEDRHYPGSDTALRPTPRAVECDGCGRRLRILAEESVGPSVWSEVPTGRGTGRLVAIEMDDDDDDRYLVTSPGGIRVSVQSGGR